MISKMDMTNSVLYTFNKLLYWQHNDIKSKSFLSRESPYILSIRATLIIGEEITFLIKKEELSIVKNMIRWIWESIFVWKSIKIEVKIYRKLSCTGYRINNYGKHWCVKGHSDTELILECPLTWNINTHKTSYTQ